MQGLSGLKIVGADIVEVAPGYDTQGTVHPNDPQWRMLMVLCYIDEITQIAAANIGWDILALMAKTPVVA
ncbi:hypothetical protein AcW1_005381 [Taiwanofungus camphoratus]|nr:hypothetical protein AcV5_005699 [Antrodia cinnamomea]KAI0956783.1 hypothetical protein AcW1_005381 [Antrodia cinnamomea]